MLRTHRLPLRALLCALLIALVAPVLSACIPSGPKPDDAAAKLVDAINSGKIADAPLTGGTGSASTQFAEILDAMKPYVPVASAGPVKENDGDASATLNLAWRDGQGEDLGWSYSTEVPLTKGDEQWSADWSPSILISGLQDDQMLRLEREFPERADILGADGTAIVTDRPVVTIGIDKVKLADGDFAASATALGQLLDIDPADMIAQGKASGDQAFVPAITLREGPERTPTNAQLGEIRGAVAVPGERALAPTRDFARMLLGSTGEATAEIIEKSDAEISPGQIVGLSGLQQRYDQQLRGTPGVTVRVTEKEVYEQAKNAGELYDWSAARVLFNRDPVPGTPLQTTLDEKAQNAADQAIKDEPSASAIVAIKVSTGEVLAAANGPNNGATDAALTGRFAPGSTFKMAGALALIRKGLTPDSTVQCPATTTIDGRTFQNSPGNGASGNLSIPFKEAFGYSCNTFFLNEAANVSQDELADAAASLGIGVEVPEFGADAFWGSVPREDSGLEHVASMIGQGRVQTSTLALATAGASVGAGKRVTPVLVKPSEQATPSDSGEPTTTGSGDPTATGDASSGVATPSNITALTADEAAALQTLMRQTVINGTTTILQELPAPPAMAKSGTAEFGTDNPPRTHSWLVAIHGDIAAAIFIEEGEFGVTSGSPNLLAFLKAVS